jgi:hypothetical protein
MKIDVFIGHNKSGYFVGSGDNILIEQVAYADVKTILSGLKCEVRWIDGPLDYESESFQEAFRKSGVMPILH